MKRASVMLSSSASTAVMRTANTHVPLRLDF
jgi:hypothetical protein